MASMTMSSALPAHTHSPVLSPFDMSSTTPYEHDSPLPSPPAQLSPAFVFPERKTTDSDPPKPTAPMSIPSGGGSHGRRASRQGRPALPEFTFNPGATMAEAASPQASPSPKIHPVLEQMAANSRQLHAAKSSTLPAFSFNPGASPESQRTPSPTKATFSDATAKATSHARPDGELAEAEKEGTEISTSPAKVDLQQPRSAPPPSGPPRGHRHRRSGALSTADIDLSSIIKANAIAKHRGGSAPGTPSDVTSPSYFDPSSVSEPGSPTTRQPALATPPTSPSRREFGSGSLPRPRVAFSDTVAEIPRPLSMISSETEGSTSTIRANHSLSNSVNSFTSPPRSTSSLSISRDDDSPQRPKSAGVYSTQTQLDSHASSIRSFSPQRPFSASGASTAVPSGSPYSKKKHFWSTSPTTSQDDVQEVEASDTESKATEQVPSALTLVRSTEATRPRTSPERKANIKKRRVRTWTGGIFSRKNKQRAAVRKGRRTPTPPLTRPVSDAVFDNDDTVVIEEPTSETPAGLPLLETQPRTLTASSLNRLSVEDSDTVSPIIDLDAALGPFGSEEKFPTASTSAAAARRRLHSSRLGGPFDEAYHRRAESAPHLPPVNRSSFGFNRMGSNSSLSEDVFDEEEEDDYLAGNISTSAPTAGYVVNHPSAGEQGVDFQSQENFSSMGTLDSESTSPDLVVAVDDVQILEEQDGSPTADRSSGSTIQPLNLETESKRPVSVPMDFAYPMPQETYASSGEGPSVPGSAISSPEVDHISFDQQRPRLGQNLNPPSREQSLRASTDDIPSLTDSVSTATGHVPRISSSANTRSSAEQRSASFSGVASWSAARASKRASLVSLTRLIPGSSHGEKSKLRFGETVQAEDQSKQRRKSNRLSRLMTFWRPKEKE